MQKASKRIRDAHHGWRWGGWLLVACLAAPAFAQARAPEATPPQYADYVLVDKSEHTLTVMAKGKVLAVYKAGFGVYPQGPKERQGDRKTPEGKYVLDYKNPNSAYFRSIHVSYPNAEDRKRARKGGYNPGGDIMVHGQPNDQRVALAVIRWPNNDWTDGCISLLNSDMAKFWEMVRVPVPIEIRP